MNGDGGVVFATGTPIANSVAEMFTMQRYLQMAALKALNIDHFDSWAATFGEPVTAMELSPDGSGYRLHTRFARFINVPELMQQFRQVADIQTQSMLKLPIPEGVKLKEPKDWKLVGKPTRRLDGPDKVDGKAIFGLDVKRPNLHTALVLHPPVFGAQVKSFNTDKVNAVLYPGGGIEGRIGFLGLRAEAGDEMYFNGGAHHNLRLAFGPFIRF